MQAVFDRSAVSTNEDVAVCTMHIRKHIALAPDVGPIDNTIRGDFTTKWTTFMNAIKGSLSLKYVCRELRYYDVPSGPGIPMGAPALIAPINIAGSSANVALPPQCAVSVTFKTSVRKQWGRFYVPGAHSSLIDSAGRITAAQCAIFSAAAAGLCSKAGTGANLTVFSRVGWTDHNVTQVQVDDIMDVIRRRRFSMPLTRSQQTV